MWKMEEMIKEIKANVKKNNCPVSTIYTIICWLSVIVFKNNVNKRMKGEKNFAGSPRTL
jgi:hypothetical protein